MKKSAHVPATLIIAIAGLSTAGCGGSSKDCVDAMGRTLPDSACNSGTPGAHWIYRNTSSGGFGRSYGGGSYGGSSGG